MAAPRPREAPETITTRPWVGSRAAASSPETGGDGPAMSAGEAAWLPAGGVPAPGERPGQETGGHAEPTGDILQLLALRRHFGPITEDEHRRRQELRIVACGAGLRVTTRVEERHEVASHQGREGAVGADLVRVAQRSDEVDHLGGRRVGVPPPYPMVVPVQHRCP